MGRKKYQVDFFLYQERAKWKVLAEYTTGKISGVDRWNIYAVLGFPNVLDKINKKLCHNKVQLKIYSDSSINTHSWCKIQQLSCYHVRCCPNYWEKYLPVCSTNWDHPIWSNCNICHVNGVSGFWANLLIPMNGERK